MKSATHHIIAGKNLWIEQWQVVKTPPGPTLIFLHEALGSVSLWKDFPQLLCETLGYNGLIYDRKGHGLSDAMDKPRDKNYLHEEALVDLRLIIEQFEIDQPILIGHSDGGSIALIYAAHYPTTAVITAAAHSYVEMTGAGGIQYAIEQYQQTVFREKLQKYHGEKTDTLFYAWADTWLSPHFADWEINSLLPKIEAPCLLLQGKEDQYASAQHLFNMASQIGSNAEAILIENCGHTPHLQAKKKTLQLMSDFILQHSPKAPSSLV